jgi:hypothetical protein
MAASKADIQSLVEKRLGLTPGEHVDLIDMYIDEIERRILNYINASVIPAGLLYTWSAMTASALQTEQLAVLFPTAEGDEAYEVKIGDTTVKPVKSVTPPDRPTIVTMDKTVFDYRAELYAYRKLRW